MIWDEAISPVARDLVAAITSSAAAEGGPPYDIARAVPWSLPLDIVEIPRLGPDAVNRWLRERGVGHRLDAANRVLHGFLLAFRSTGLVFVDAEDPDVERRYTVAHEVAHFVVDYWLPRQRAVDHFGPSIQEVLDGDRAPSLKERLDSAFMQIPLDSCVFLLDRFSPTPARTEVWSSENRADRLAVEFVAPLDEVCGAVRAEGALDGYFHVRRAAQRILFERFGLPDRIAQAYARYVADEITGGMSAMESWGL
ncbi:MAG TPA: hypothetical protein VFQ39_03870 [Longimicrobium sp.]|nr:hypothetical protein [Longimicrobium sp.]